MEEKKNTKTNKRIPKRYCERKKSNHGTLDPKSRLVMRIFFDFHNFVKLF